MVKSSVMLFVKQHNAVKGESLLFQQLSAESGQRAYLR